MFVLLFSLTVGHKQLRPDEWVKGLMQQSPGCSMAINYTLPKGFAVAELLLLTFILADFKSLLF